MLKPIAEAAAAVVEDVRLKRDIRPLAKTFAAIMVNNKIDVADEAAVENHVRLFGPALSPAEVDHLVEICPDIARGIAAERLTLSDIN